MENRFTSKPLADGGEILTPEKCVDEKLRRRCTEKFDALIGPLRAVAREHGYALAVHGSLKRDIDLIAAPWTEQTSAPDVLASALRDEADRITGCAFWLNDTETPEDANDYTRRNPRPKPHGRLAWSIHLGGGPYIDLSVMPPNANDAALQENYERAEARAEKAERERDDLVDQVLKWQRGLHDAADQRDAHKARAEKLAAALREIVDQTERGYCAEPCSTHIARSALAENGEEK